MRKQTTKTKSEDVVEQKPIPERPQAPPSEEELKELKAAAYDLHSEINRLTGILTQVNTRIEQLKQQLQAGS